MGKGSRLCVGKFGVWRRLILRRPQQTAVLLQLHRLGFVSIVCRRWWLRLIAVCVCKKMKWFMRKKSRPWDRRVISITSDRVISLPLCPTDGHRSPWIPVSFSKMVHVTRQPSDVWGRKQCDGARQGSRSGCLAPGRRNTARLEQSKARRLNDEHMSRRLIPPRV